LPKKVRSLIYPELRKVELKEFDKPKAASDSIILKVDICGICGTDLHIFEGVHPAGPFPIMPGHEFVGTIEEMGDKVEDNMRIYGEPLELGDRLAVNPNITCGKCYFCKWFPHREELCRNMRSYGVMSCKNYPYLLGAWSEYIYLLPGTTVFKLPSTLASDIAVLTEPLACGIRAIERARGPGDATKGEGFGLSDTVVILGAGPIGLLVLIAAKISNAGKIIVADKVDYRLKTAKKFGADNVMNLEEIPEAEKRIEEVLELTGGIGADVVVECAGVPSAISEGLKMVRPGGKFMELGHVITGVKAEITPYDVCRNEIQIMGQFAYGSSAFIKAIKVLDEHRLPYEELVTKFSLEDKEEAFERIRTKKTIKTAFVPSLR